MNLFERLGKTYRKRSLEVRKKAKYLFVVNIIILALILVIILSHFITKLYLPELTGQFLSFAFLLLSIALLFQTRLNSAIYFCILAVIMLISGETVISDLIEESPHFLSIYKTTALILIGFGLVGLFALKKQHVFFYGILSFLLFLVHFFILFDFSQPEFNNSYMYFSLVHALVYLLVGLLISYYSVTKQHNLVQSIEASRNKAHFKYKLLFKNMPIAYVNIRITTDEEGSIINGTIKETNARFNSLCGLESQEILEKYYSQLPEHILKLLGPINDLGNSVQTTRISNYLHQGVSYEFHISSGFLKTNEIALMISEIKMG